MASGRIYDIDFRKLLIWLIPEPLRSCLLIAWVRAFVSPVVFLYNSFVLYRNNMIYNLNITPQVCFLEKLLNDRYDNDQRRIHIARGKRFDEVFLFQKEENKPVGLYRKSENKPVYFYQKSETGNYTVKFIIRVPLSLNININEFNALLESFKMPDAEHRIQRF